MSETWGNYQSAIQFVAALNLALLAFPRLRQLETNNEADKWGRLLRTVPIDDPNHGHIRYAAVTYRRTCELVERKHERARAACLFATVSGVAALLWATLYADHVVNKPFAWLIIATGLAPALYFCAYDQYVVRQIARAASKRRVIISERPR